MSNLGEILRDVRQRRDLTLDDVEAATRIRKKYLIALEQGDFARLPAMVYAKGFLRTYAEYLDIDAEAVLEMFPEPAASLQMEPTVQLQKPPRAVGSWLVVAIVIAMVGAVGIYLYQQGATTIPEPEPMAALEIPTATPIPTAIPSPTPKVYADLVETQIRAVEPTWLSVFVDSQPVFTGTLMIGDNLTWTGHEKVWMWVGNAGGLEVTLNGQRKGLLGRAGEVLYIEFTVDGFKAQPYASATQQPAGTRPTPTRLPSAQPISNGR